MKEVLGYVHVTSAVRYGERDEVKQDTVWIILDREVDA